MRVVVTEIGRDGGMRRRTLDICGLTGAGRRETLDRADPGVRAAVPGGSGSPAYVLRAGDRAVLAGGRDLAGPLRDLAVTILAAGGPP